MVKKQSERADVLEVRPNLTFLLRLLDGKEIQGYLSGKMAKGNLKVVIGDKVLVEVDPYQGKVSNRIVRRL